MDERMVAAVIVMVIFFLGIPVLLGVLVYRAAQKSKKRGIYFLVGVLLISAIMLTLYTWARFWGLCFRFRSTRRRTRKHP